MGVRLAGTRHEQAWVGRGRTGERDDMTRGSESGEASCRDEMGGRGVEPETARTSPAESASAGAPMGGPGTRSIGSV